MTPKILAVQFIVNKCDACGSWRHYRVIFSDRSTVGLCHACGRAEKSEGKRKELQKIIVPELLTKKAR